MTTRGFSKDNAQTTVSNGGSAISSGATSVPVAAATNFPSSGVYCVKTPSGEVMQITGGQGTTTWTVVRGVGGTTAASIPDGATLKEVLSSVDMLLMAQLSDSRFTDSRTPTAHAASHASGGSDAVTMAPSQVTGTAVITTDSRLSDTRTPTDGSVTTAKIADGAVTTAKHADSGVTAATYGDATHVAQIAIDAKGRVTSASNVAVSGSSLTTAHTEITSDVAPTSINTWTDVCSVSLAAGTWLVNAKYIYAWGGVTNNGAVRLYDGTTEYDVAEMKANSTVTWQPGPLLALVVAGSTITLKMQVLTDALGGKALGTPELQGSAGHQTRITAVKVA